MEIKKLKCNNCGTEIEHSTWDADWIVLKIACFYKLVKAPRDFLQEQRLDFCCEQCFLNYFITLINLKEKKDA